MQVSHFRQMLQQRERDLAADIARLQDEARNSREAEVQDPMDEVISAEGKAVAFETSSREFEELAQVRDALRRIEDGTYGKCSECGRQIEQARLEAVPWARYCLEDQEKHDRASRPESGATL